MSEPLDIRLSFRFGETDKRQLDELCEDTGLDGSSVIRYLIRARRREGLTGSIQTNVEGLRQEMARQVQFAKASME